MAPTAPKGRPQGPPITTTKPSRAGAPLGVQRESSAMKVSAINALRQRKLDLRAKRAAILENPRGENGGLTDEQRAEDDKLAAEAEGLAGDLQRAEALAAEERSAPDPVVRSEERRVGKEWRCRRA